jgi:hypothetical protein
MAMVHQDRQFMCRWRAWKSFIANSQSKNYGYLRPGLEKTPWNTLGLSILDPFGNMIRFNEPVH